MPIAQFVPACDDYFQQIIARELHKEQKPIGIEQYLPRQIARKATHDFINDMEKKSNTVVCLKNFKGLKGVYGVWDGLGW